MLDAERTVNGRPIPAHLVNLIAYEMTDQGLAEKNAKRVDSAGRPHSGIRITKNEGFDRAIEQRANAIEPWECSDPLKEAADRYGKPGFRYRGLSDLINKKKTLRGWEPVRDEKGDVVKVGSLILGEMPIERAEKRNKHFRDLGNSERDAAAQRLKVDQEKLTHAARSQGFEAGPLRDGDVLTDHADPDRHVSIGVHSQRGLSGAEAA